MCSQKDFTCRVCLDETNSNLTSIFDDELFKIFEMFTYLPVDINDVYPKHLCSTCCGTLQSFIKFKNKAHQAKNVWELKLLSSKISERLVSEIVSEDDNNGDSEKFFIMRSKKCEKSKLKPRKSEDKTKITKGTDNRTKQQDFLSCGICEKEFDSLSQVKHHIMRRHPFDGNLSCQICEYTATDFAELFVHRYSHCPPGGTFRKACLACKSNRPFRESSGLEFHFRKFHLKQTPGVCKLCPKTFADYRLFKQHLWTHTGNRFTCDLCKKTFTSKKILRSHIRSLHGSEPRFVCDYCGMSFRRSFNLGLHISNRHRDNKPVACDECRKIFKSELTLNDHKRRHHGRKPFSCSVCKKAFSTKTELKEHALWHSDDRPHVCQTCGTAYKSKCNLKQHVKSKHMGFRYCCDRCDKKFSSKMRLNDHILTNHDGGKQFREKKQDELVQNVTLHQI